MKLSASHGIYCPECRGVRLSVQQTKLPCPGVRIRYRVCVTCGCKIITREVLISAAPSRKRR